MSGARAEEGAGTLSARPAEPGIRIAGCTSGFSVRLATPAAGVLIQARTLSAAIEAFRALDARQRGWIRVGLKP
jgi:hypothetical protein